jgi:hypothetical protein
MRFLKRCIHAYWGDEHCEDTIDAAARMRSVIGVVADEIESMAPSRTVAKICHLQCMEIAERLRGISNEQG